MDTHVKESMSETFVESQMSETIDVPAGCLAQFQHLCVTFLHLKQVTHV